MLSGMDRGGRSTALLATIGGAVSVFLWVAGQRGIVMPDWLLTTLGISSVALGLFAAGLWVRLGWQWVRSGRPIGTLVCELTYLRSYETEKAPLHVLTPVNVPTADGGGGFAKLSGAKGKSTVYDMPGYLCRVTSYAPTALTDVAFKFRVVFQEAVIEGNQVRNGTVLNERIWEAAIPVLNPGAGNGFEFFISDGMPTYMTVFFPDVATGVPVDGHDRKNLAVRHDKRRGIMIMPNEKWLDEQLSKEP